MKIHKLTLKNINSLSGTWEINFDDEAYCQNGIFGIVGNTGSGKTTILDAICLAIYRETPRLGKITENNNALITIGATECRAQVELSVNNKCYRFLFKQNRATKGKYKGELQEPSHEVFLQDEKGDFKLIGEKRTDSERLAIELLGMNFTQFTRSVLLAQGGFSAFLQADKERGQILEKITGTEIYAEIGKKVYHTHKIKKEFLDSQKSRLGDIAIISDDELSQLKLSVDNINNKKSELEEKLNIIDDKIKQKNLHNQLNNDLTNYQQQFTKIDGELVNFEPKLTILNNAKHHNELLPIFNHLNSLKNKKNELKNQEDILREHLNHEKNQLIYNQENLAKTQTNFNHHIDYLKQQIENKKNILIHYQSLKQINADGIATHLMNCTHELEKLLNKTNELKQKQNKVTQLREEQQNTKQQLHQHCQDIDGDKIQNHLMVLNNELNDINMQLGNIDYFIHQFHQLLNKKDTYRQKQHEINEQQVLCQKNEQIFNEKQIALQQLISEYELLDKNYRLSDEINRLNDFIEVLTEGSPCPLCGSKHHPYVNNPPMRENTHILKEQLNHKKSELTKLENAQKNAELQLIELKTGIGHQIEQLKELEHEINGDNIRLNQEWANLSSYVDGKVSFDELNGELLTGLKHRIGDFHKNKKETYEIVNDLFMKYQSHQQKEKEIIQEWRDIKDDCLPIFMLLTNEVNRLVPLLNHEYVIISDFLGQKLDINVMSHVFETVQHMQVLHEDLKKEKLERFHQLASQLEGQMEDFKYISNAIKTQFLTAIQTYQQKYHECEQAQITLKHYQNNNTQYHTGNFNQHQTREIDDNTLSQSLKNYQDELIKNKEVLTLSEQKINDLTNRLNDNEQQLKNNQQELSLIENEFNVKLLQYFKNYDDFLTAKLDDEELNCLENHHQYLVENKKQTQIKIHEIQRKIEVVINDNHDINEWFIDELTESYTTLKMALEDLLTDFGIKQEKYAQATQNQQKKSVLLKEIEQLENEFAPLHQLNELIGSADGKKYRDFAQTLTLRALLVEANAELAKINKRYLLTPSHDDKNILGIDVIDTHQGDVVRQSKNLSGGESFVVSLALALGLSKMSSQRMQIDSLFLDEGFGTLDEEALESALSALSEIQSDGKMIGIISHIGALKERLHTKITVKKKSGGVSVLVGAGVTQID